MTGLQASPAPDSSSAAGLGGNEQNRVGGEKTEGRGSGIHRRAYPPSPILFPLRSPPSRVLLLGAHLDEDFVHQAELLGLLGVEVAVALRLGLDHLQGLAGVLGEDLVEALLLLEDL